MTLDLSTPSPGEHSQAELIARADALVADGIAPSLGSVSKRLFNDFDRLTQLKTGRSFLRPPTMADAFAKLAALEANPPWRKRTPGTPEAANARDA